MNRRQLAFVILMNALISIMVVLTVVWVVELRRPDPEALAAIYTPPATPPVATFTPTPDQAVGPQLTVEQPAPAEPAVPTATGDEEVYVVQAGESLSGIADRFGISVAAIVEANRLDNPDFVFSGQRLAIPRPGSAPAATATPVVPATSAAGEGIRITAFAGTGNLTSESVSVANDSDLAVNLQGWRLEKEGGPSYTFGNILLFPGSGIFLYTGTGTDTSVAVYWNQAEPVWQAGAVARLVNAQGTVVTQLAAP